MTTYRIVVVVVGGLAFIYCCFRAYKNWLAAHPRVRRQVMSRRQRRKQERKTALIDTRMERVTPAVTEALIKVLDPIGAEDTATEDTEGE